MRPEEADCDDCDTQDDERQRLGGGQRDAQDQHCDRYPEDQPPPSSAGKLPEPGRAGRTQQIEQEDRAHFGVAKRVRRAHQPETGKIIDRHEHAHQQKGFRIEQWHCPVGKQPPHAADEFGAAGARWRETAGGPRCR